MSVNEISPIMRLEYLSKVQAFAIFLVVFGHSFIVPEGGRPYLGEFIVQSVYSFHMPLYMFISGFLYLYTSARKNDEKYSSFMKKKAKRLMIPYVFLGTVAFIIKAFMNKYAVRSADISIGGYLHSLLYPTDNANLLLWFIGCLFGIFAFAHVLKNVICKNRLIGILFVFVMAFLHIIFAGNLTTLLGIDSIVRYLVFFTSGIYVAHYLIEYVQRLDNMIVLVVSGLLVLVNMYFKLNHQIIIPIIPAFIGIVFSFSLGLNLSKTNVNLSWLEKYNYQIYLLSWFPQAGLMAVLMRTSIFPYPVSCVLMCSSGLIIPLSCVWFVNKFVKNIPIRMLIGMK